MVSVHEIGMIGIVKVAIHWEAKAALITVVFHKKINPDVIVIIGHVT